MCFWFDIFLSISLHVWRLQLELIPFIIVFLVIGVLIKKKSIALTTYFFFVYFNMETYVFENVMSTQTFFLRT